MFETDNTQFLKSYPRKLVFVDPKDLTIYDWIVDTTASQNVQNYLISQKFTHPVNIARCELAEYGKIGMLYIEGLERNPRIDDLVNLAY